MKCVCHDNICIVKVIKKIIHNLTYFSFLFCLQFTNLHMKTAEIYGVVIFYTGIMVYRENKDAIKIWCWSIPSRANGATHGYTFYALNCILR